MWLPRTWIIAVRGTRTEKWPHGLNHVDREAYYLLIGIFQKIVPHGEHLDKISYSSQTDLLEYFN